ncbi:TonB-dependent receptor [Marinicaulis aureus]|uniref:TonB-dependent receptor n=1 Tax=Hyphococcus aureus TaxID=2666033 RepID=A0ABW1KU19_9PROT
MTLESQHPNFIETRRARTIRARLISAGSAMALALGGGAYAQSDEIVVTAQKREQTLQEVPISISVVDGGDIKDQGIFSILDLSINMPGVSVFDSGTINVALIRGVGTEGNLGFEQSVGFFLDDIYLSRSRLNELIFLDIDRVEVLKGPQGTLFGKNTVAGAINITSKKPTDEFEGYLNGLYEFNHGELLLTGAVSGPISDRVRGRVALRYGSMDGFLTNDATGEKEPQREDVSGRVSLEADVSDNLVASASYQFEVLKEDGNRNQTTQCSAFDQFVLGFLMLPVDDCTPDTHKSSYGDPALFGGVFTKNFKDITAHLGRFQLDWTIPGHTVTAITTYTDMDYDDANDADVTALSALHFEVEEQLEQWTQEIRLTSTDNETVDYIVGAYYQAQHFVNGQDLHVYDPSVPLAVTRVGLFDQETDMIALFAQADLHVTDALTLTGGLRYTHEKKSAMKNQFFAGAGTRAEIPMLTDLGPLGASHTLSDSRTVNKLTPMVGIDYDITDGVMGYFRYSTGFKSGGFDAFGARLTPANFGFDDESVTSYEAGLKTVFAEGRGSFNLALFRSKFDDLQVSIFPGGGGLAIDFIVGNAAKVISQGVEVDAAFTLAEGVRISGAATFLDAEYDEFMNTACYSGQTLADGCVGGVQDISGRPVQYAPDIAANIGLDLRHDITAGLYAAARFELSYSSDYFRTSDLDPGNVEDDATRINARVGLYDGNDRWNIAFVGRNLTNEQTLLFQNDHPAFAGGYYGYIERPRTLAIQTEISF